LWVRPTNRIIKTEKSFVEGFRYYVSSHRRDYLRVSRAKGADGCRAGVGLAVATATLELRSTLATAWRMISASGANLLVHTGHGHAPSRNRRRRLPARGCGRLLGRRGIRQVENDFLAQQRFIGFAPFLDVPVEIAAASARGSQAPGSGSRKIIREPLAKPVRETLIERGPATTVAVPDGSKFVRVYLRRSWWRVDGRLSFPMALRSR